jgi:hypothetical protein
MTHAGIGKFGDEGGLRLGNRRNDSPQRRKENREIWEGLAVGSTAQGHAGSGWKLAGDAGSNVCDKPWQSQLPGNCPPETSQVIDLPWLAYIAIRAQVFFPKLIGSINPTV